MLRNAPTWLLSLIVHLSILAGLALISMPARSREVAEAIESLFEEERTHEDFQKELDKSEIVAETMNFIPGAGSVIGSTAGGLGGPGGVGGPGGLQGTGAKIDQAANVADADVVIGAGDVDIPGGDSIGTDLGMGKVAGEVGAVVEGYGAALDRISQEVLREMRDQKLCVVWLFDESESMKDDQADIKKRIGRVYEELKIVADKSKNDELVNAIVSFGERIHYHTPRGKVTDSIPEQMKAIDQIPNDPSGIENTFAAIVQVVNEYRPYFVKAKRKLVIILVSDESGDDGPQHLEEAIELCKKSKVSVYVLGRESIFGYPYAYINWVEPVQGTTHWLPVRRGPETPFAELLQFDGFLIRRDASQSGFGPYEQCRLTRDTGGVFFILPTEDQNVINADLRKYAALDMKPYAPELSTHRDYAMKRDANPFRATVWQVISLLDPHVPGNDKVQVPLHGYSLAKGQYEAAVVGTLTRCSQTFDLLTQAQLRLEAVQKLRAKEDSRRWRANYDLMLAQVKSYRVRLFQYATGLEHFADQLPKMKHDPKANTWGVGHGSPQLLKPSPEQEKKYKVSLSDITAARDAAVKEFDKVIAEHPNTPWANKAAWEKTRGYGASYGEWFTPPPPPPNPNAPKPQPVPKL